MKIKILSSILTFLMIFSIYGSSYYISVYAQNELPYEQNCDIDSVNPDCQPPTLRSLEDLFVNILYIAWFMGGLLWLGYFIYIASFYMRGDPSKIEEAKKRFGIWVAGIVIYYLSYVIVAQVMSAFVGGSSDCYNKFDGTPGFYFFFEDVCT